MPEGVSPYNSILTHLVLHSHTSHTREYFSCKSINLPDFTAHLHIGLLQSFRSWQIGCKVCLFVIMPRWTRISETSAVLTECSRPYSFHIRHTFAIIGLIKKCQYYCFLLSKIYILNWLHFFMAPTDSEISFSLFVQIVLPMRTAQPWQRQNGTCLLY